MTTVDALIKVPLRNITGWCLNLSGALIRTITVGEERIGSGIEREGGRECGRERGAGRGSGGEREIGSREREGERGGG